MYLNYYCLFKYKLYTSIYSAPICVHDCMNEYPSVFAAQFFFCAVPTWQVSFVLILGLFWLCIRSLLTPFHYPTWQVSFGLISGLFWLYIRSLLASYSVSFGYVLGLFWPWWSLCESEGLAPKIASSTRIASMPPPPPPTRCRWPIEPLYIRVRGPLYWVRAPLYLLATRTACTNGVQPCKSAAFTCVGW